MAEDVKPWDAVFDRVQVSREPKAVPHPLPTDEQIAEVEKQLGHRLPASYRAFAQRFGLNGICGTTYLVPIHYPVKASRALIPNTNRLRAGLGRNARQHAEWNQHAASAERVVFFNSGGSTAYTWDPAETTDAEGPEYQIYQFHLPEPEPILVTDSFWGFLEVRQSWDWEDGHDPAQPDAIWFKPFITRNKTRPAKSDVKLWLASNNHTARDLALSIRDAGHTDAFPILADALEEAGCTNADLLDSCRTGDPDIDGKWVLQVLLGKA